MQAKEAAVAVSSTSQKPIVGQYVKLNGKVSSSSDNLEGSLSNYFTGSLDVYCNGFETLAMSGGPEVVPMALDDINYNFNGAILPKDGVDVGKSFTLGSGKDAETVNHKLMNYSLVEAEELTVVKKFHTTSFWWDFLGLAEHYELVATNSVGRKIPFFIHKTALTEKQKSVLNSLAVGDKFSFKGGVLFAHQKDNKTYVKLSSQKSVITKL